MNGVVSSGDEEFSTFHMRTREGTQRAVVVSEGME